jgi:hypothetical protein
LAGGLFKFYPNTGGKRSIQRHILLVQYKHQANPLLSLNNYTPLVISRNDKNNFLHYKIIGAPKKIKKPAASLSWALFYKFLSKVLKSISRDNPLKLNLEDLILKSYLEFFAFSYLSCCCKILFKLVKT